MSPRAALLVCAAFALAACERPAAEKVEPVRTVRTVTVTPADIDKPVTLPGEIRARHESRLAFRVGGKLVARQVDVGQQVKTGQVLARLDPEDVKLAEQAREAAAAATKVELDLAAADLARFRELLAKNFISKAEFDRRQANWDGARARHEAAVAQLSESRNQAAYTTLAADHPGVVTALDAEVGQVVAAGQTVIRVARPDETEVVVAVPESQVELLRRTKEFAVTLSAAPGRTWTGRLRELAPSADPATRTFAARIAVPEADAAMRLGMSASVTIDPPGARAAILLPLTALYTKNDKAHVWTVDPKSQSVVLTPVRTGGFSGNDIIVSEGLKPGDVVVTAGAHLLVPGQKVAPGGVK